VEVVNVEIELGCMINDENTSACVDTYVGVRMLDAVIAPPFSVVNVIVEAVIVEFTVRSFVVIVLPVIVENWMSPGTKREEVVT
jgi:hypothetical protein